MSSSDGKPLAGAAHLRQSVRDILSTPIGSRVMRRSYGSNLYQYIDVPLNRSTLIDIYAATADALVRWEPRLRLQQVFVDRLAAGELILTLEGEDVQLGRTIRLEGIRL